MTLYTESSVAFASATYRHLWAVDHQPSTWSHLMADHKKERSSQLGKVKRIRQAIEPPSVCLQDDDQEIRVQQTSSNDHGELDPFG